MMIHEAALNPIPKAVSVIIDGFIDNPKKNPKN